MAKLSRFDDSSPTFDVPGETRQVLPLTIALVHVISGRHREAIEVLDKTIEMVRRDDLRRDLCEALLIRAMASLGLRLESEARRAVTEAFVLASNEGFVSTFARYKHELPPLFRLFDASAETGPFSPPILELLELPAARRSGLLSDREIEILSEIARGSSNAEAARKLFISPQTVKKHLENVYAKLGVGNRTEAVDVARREGLL